VSTRPDTAVLAALAALRIDPRHPPARALVRALLDSHPDRAEYVRRLRDARDAEAPGPIRDLLDEALASADPVTGRTR